MNMIRRPILSIFILILLAPQLMACAAPPTPAPIAIGQPTPLQAPTATPEEAVPTQIPTTATPAVGLDFLGTRQSQVDALWYAVGMSGPYGGTSKVTVSVERNPAREVRVGFYEEEVMGSGAMWRSSGWMAAIIASFLLGEQMVDYRYTFDVGGRIDGPSAGCLMTIAVLASLLGHEVDPEATMTGTINPDGTIGPVGGIPQKLEGAVDTGKNLVLIPIGSRYQFDPSINQFIDVIEYGERLGVEVIEVSDVYEAFDLLVGQPLPRARGVSDRRPNLPTSAYNKTQAKVKEWLSRYSQERSRYDSLAAEIKLPELEELMATASSYAEQADRSFRQGLVAAAYSQSVYAAMYATSGYEIGKVLERLLLSGLDGAVSHLNSLATVDARIDAMLDRLKVEQPRTLDDAMALASAYGNLTIAMGISNLAAGQVQSAINAQTEDELYTAVFMAAMLYALTEHALQAADDVLDIGRGYGQLPAPDEKDVETLADALRRAAEANIVYFDSVVLADLAAAYGVHPDVLKQSFMSFDMNYTFATSSLSALPYIRAQLGPAGSSGYAVLGASLASFQLSSLLITKYYSLEAETDESGHVVAIGNEKALIEMFDFVDRRARENINLALSVGAEAVIPILEYEAARNLREGNMDEKLEALQSFWLASLEAQVLAILSGKVEMQY